MPKSVLVKDDPNISKTKLEQPLTQIRKEWKSDKAPEKKSTSNILL